MARYLATETANAMAAGRLVRLTRGALIELTDEEAKELARIGLIEFAPAAPAEIETPAPVAEIETPAPARRGRARPRG